MASVVKICNMALGHIGSEARVASISPPDGSAEAGQCEAYYDQARTEMLEPGSWAFSLKRAKLAPLANNPSTAWAYAYALPSDCMRALRIPAVFVSGTEFREDEALYSPNDRAGEEFDVEGAVLYTNAPEAVLVYVRDVTDTTQFTPSFTTALSYLLASYLAGPIIKGSEGTRVGDAMRQRALAIAATSAAAAANASSASQEFRPSSIAARQ